MKFNQPFQTVGLEFDDKNIMKCKIFNILKIYKILLPFTTLHKKKI